MKKFKKALSTLLVITVVASILIAGTLAYLTKDAGKATNVFSVGDIDVTLDEEVAVIGQGGEVKKDDDGADYEGIMPGDYLQKEVTVTNEGDTPAYVAVTVDVNNFSQIRDAIESYGEDDENAEAMLDYVFDGWGLTVKDRLVGEKKDMSYKVNELVDSSILHVDSAKRITENDVAHFSMNNWFKSEAEATATGYTVAGTGNSFYLKYADDYSLRFTYYIHLNGGASATLFKGLNVPAEFKADQMKMFDELKINVSAKAIQADNMGIAETYKNEDESTAKAKTAFAILHGLVSEDDVNVDNNPNDTIEVAVTSENLDSIDFTKDNARFVFSGKFTDDMTITVAEGLNQEYDATNATFESGKTVTVKAPGIAHAYSSLQEEREGNVVVKGFEVQTLNVLAYNNETVTISDNTVNAISVIGGNFKLIMSENKINGNFSLYFDGEGQKNEYGVSLRITDYELAFINNTITDVYSHAIGINGRQGEAASDWANCGTNNKIESFTGNKITVNTTQKTGRAALKIWCDQVYAPYGTSTQTPGADARELMDTIKADTTNVFTLGNGHTTFNIFDYKE